MTGAVIDLFAMSQNLGIVQSVLDDTELLAVVKADAYGHGMIPVAKFLRSQGVRWMGVALPSEAVTLRQAGDNGRILAWLWAPGDPDLEFCVAAGVDLGVSNLESLKSVVAAAQSTGLQARIQLKVYTGLWRNGCPLSDWGNLVDEVLAVRAREPADVEVTAVWSHLANADLYNDESVRRQQDHFEEACAVAAELGLTIPMRHLANTAATFLYPQTHYDMVRVGIGLYGLAPCDDIEVGLQPVMSLVSTIVSIKTIPAGESVSYGSTWTATESTHIALVLGGYADGIPRAASNRAHVRINGRQHPVIGRISMDQFMVALTGPAQVGDPVMIFGDEPTADDWAWASDSIVHEVVSRIGQRVRRRYLDASIREPHE